MLISIITPCYNEEEVINETIRRLNNSVKNIDKYKFEFIFINDGSTDRTEQILKKNSLTDKKIKIISFSRNFGHQAALAAGLENCKGDAAIIIDADLQDPPELIKDMIIKWNKGFKVVYGKRIERKNETIFKKLTAKYFYRILNFLAEVDIPLDTGDFRLIDKSIIEILKTMPENKKFYRGLIAWCGFKQTAIEYSRDKRFAGKTKYPLFKMIQFSVDGILSLSIKPLKIITFIGFFIAFVSFFGIANIIYNKIVYGTLITGWASLLVTILFIGGIQLISIGILGEYLGRSYSEIQKRPKYIISKKVGF